MAFILLGFARKTMSFNRSAGLVDWCRCLLVLSVGLLPLQADADKTRFYDSRTLLVDGVYRISTRIDFQLKNTVIEALENGVPVSIEIHMEVHRKRDFGWSKRKAHLNHRMRLEYHALSNRYIVDRKSSGVQLGFRKLEDALYYMGNLYDLPLIDENLLNGDKSYTVRVRAEIEIEHLPTPIRLWAYLGSDWSLNSDWHQWPLKQ